MIFSFLEEGVEMEILGCKAVPVVRLRMKIGSIGMVEGGEVNVTEEGSQEKRRMTIWVPKGVATRLAVGNVIEVLCITSPDLRSGLETLFLSIKKDGVGHQLYAKSEMWTEEYKSLGFGF